MLLHWTVLKGIVLVLETRTDKGQDRVKTGDLLSEMVIRVIRKQNHWITRKT